MFASLLCNLVIKTVAVQLSHWMSDIMSRSQAGDVSHDQRIRRINEMLIFNGGEKERCGLNVSITLTCGEVFIPSRDTGRVGRASCLIWLWFKTTTALYDRIHKEGHCDTKPPQKSL